jgi:DNA invertase Pin-like site-specific DNA recombinase
MTDNSADAVYTRKSSEEGLDMVFNSLDAQREAGLDYIKSQRSSHGWVAIDDPYDDGGFSGGNTERPGLKRLLADIRARRVDIVVVYKVDRLSRSLATTSPASCRPSTIIRSRSSRSPSSSTPRRRWGD